LVWIGLVVAVAVVVVAGIYAVFWPLSDLIARHDVGAIAGPHRAPALQAARDAARGRLLTFGAASFAGGALVYTAHNATLARRALELARRAVEIAGQGQVPDPYTEAIKQLGSDNLDVRIGGIYALERIARDSPRDHPTIMEVLAAFIREHSHEQWPPAEDGAEPPERATRPDVQAAATVMGRRILRHDTRQIDLGAANLTGANLAGARLTGADLTGARLTGAKLIRADLVGADLTGADLTGARLVGARLADADLTGARLADAKLNGARLAGALWPADMAEPQGWQRDAESGRLTRTKRDSGDAAAE
jgi:hypothetical protein